MKASDTFKLAIGYVAVLLLCVGARLAKADIIDISVATDKETYLLGEDVTVFVTAYNPNPDPITLYFASSLQASYLMDGVFDWRTGKGFEYMVTKRVIEPYDSRVWQLDHGTYEKAIYPLSIGRHTVVGEVVGYGQSAPVEFQVIPEPASVLLIGLGALWIRAGKRGVPRQIQK